MVEQTFINKFQEIIEEITTQRGAVNLFAILKMDDLTDKWIVILSAAWINDKSRDEVFFLVREQLIKHLETSERSLIARIGLFEPSEHLIELMLDKHKSGDYISHDEKINGNLIHEGHILVCNRIDSKQQRII